MYAETELLFPFFQNFSQEVQLLDDFCGSHKLIDQMGNLVQTSTVLEYDLGGEGDLFKAPEPIIEEIFMGIDPMEAVISMISCGEDVISTQALEAADIESIQIDHLSEIFYDCKRDILAKEGLETPLSDTLDMTIPLIRTEENLIAEDELNPDGPFLESVSSGCLTSMDWIDGMRRALSEGDIETLGNGHVSLVHSPLGHPQFIGNCASEDRKQKLSRYRNKKTKRNFGRKIKYACRKALADSQPRIRGRFARTEESEFPKKQLL